MAGELERLAALRERGALTEENYQDAVRRLLGQYQPMASDANPPESQVGAQTDATRRVAGWRWGILGGYLELVQMAFAMIGIVALVITLFLLPGNLAALFGGDPIAVVTAIPLLAVDFLLALAWWHVGKREMETLKFIGDEFIPPVPWYTPLLVIGAAATFVALAVASLSPVLFGLVLLLLKTQESVNSWVARRGIRDGAIALLRTARVDANRKRRTLVLTDYYFRHPWDAWESMVVLATALATVVGAYLINVADSTLHRIGLLGIAILLAAIVASNELVAHVWRQERNRGLDAPPEDGSTGNLRTDWPESIAPETPDSAQALR